MHGHGRVEVFHNGTWGTVCQHGWDLDDATVVCKELGFLGAVSALGGVHFGPGSGPIWLSNVSCSPQGRGGRLSWCRHIGWGQSSCGHELDAGVVCQCEFVQ